MTRNKKKVHLRVFFTFVLIIALVSVSVSLTLLFLHGVNHYAGFAFHKNKENILSQTKSLLKNNARRESKFYSAYFNNLNTSINLITTVASEQLLKVSRELDIQNTKIIKLKPGYDNGIFINNFDFDNQAFIYIADDKDTKIFSEKQKHDLKIATKLISELQPRVYNIWDGTNAPYLYDAWVLYRLSTGYFIFLFPNRLKYLDARSPEWGRAVELSLRFMNLLRPENDIDKSVLWSSVHVSMGGNRLQTIMSPVYTKKNQFIGSTGITLRVNSALLDIIGANSSEHILRSKKAKVNLSGNFAFVMNNDNELVAFPIKYASLFGLTGKQDANSKIFYEGKLSDSKYNRIKKLESLMHSKKSGIIELSLDKKNFLLSYSRMDNGWILVEVVPEITLLGSVIRSLEKFRYIVEYIYIVIFAITVFLVVFGVIIWIIMFNKLLFKPILNLGNKGKQLGEGEFDISLDENLIREINDLSKAFIYLSKGLKNYRENLRMEIDKRLGFETEVKIAGDIQFSLLPPVTDRFNNSKFEIGTKILPAKSASGDFYDFFYLDESSVAFLIADVSGKGISAAFFMAISKAVLRSAAIRRYKDGPGSVLELANNMLEHDNDQAMFVTVFLAFYNLKTGELQYANAGHHSSTYINKQGRLQQFGMFNNMALGILPEIEYETKNIELEYNEKIAIYTDGTFEAINNSQTLYGEERLYNLISENSKLRPNYLAEKIAEDVRNFEEGMKFDDITVLIFEKKS